MVDDPRENPEAAAIDAGWDLDAGEDPAPSTVGVESLELLARAGMAPARPLDATLPAPPMPAPRSQRVTPVPGTVPPVTESSAADVKAPKTPPRPAPTASSRPVSAPPGRLPLRPPPAPPGTPSKAPETERNAPPPPPPPAKPPHPSRTTTARAMPKASALKQASRSDKPAPLKGGLRRPTARKLTPLVKDSAERAKRLDQRATLPPPVPPSEYVSRMMGQLEGERPPPTVPSEVALTKLGRDADVDDSTPLIEMVEEMLEDIDPELLRDTPAPGDVDLAATEELPAADARAILRKAEKLAELDDLPVETVLGGMARLADRETPVPVGDDLSLELSTSDPPLAPAISDFPLDGRGLTGPPGGRSLGEVAEELDPLLQPVEERFSVGDYSGALVLAEGLLEEHHEHPQILRYVESCQDMLRQMYMSRLGDGSDIPRVAMAADQLRWLTLDHRAGFLLSCIDGSCSIDEVLDVATMPPLEALRTLYEMVQEGVVEISPSSGRR